ncbi:MAG: DUF962 domain-containing protein [Bacteroidia bacterium]|nr:DUF962 domain-containing protein [Bacteroidia bacterium]MDW8158675.1 DUF962 domain-containing protein [Bacteroidia bacterium]
MRSVDEWFHLYGESHQNPTNKLIHWICIPLIMFSLLGLLKSIPVPEVFPSQFDFSWLLIVGAFIFYLMLSWQLSIGMLCVVAIMLLGLKILKDAGVNLLMVSLVIFFVSWIFQFIGHKIEGKKPSFFTDLQFLLIGPLWLLGFIYRRLGIRYSSQKVKA